MRDGGSQVPRSDRPDSLHVPEVGVSRVHDCLQAAEAPEQCTCRHRRDAGNGCEDALCGRRLGPLRVHGAVSARRSPRCAPRDSVDPQCRIGSRLATHDGHAVLGGREQRSANPRCRDRAGVERCSFDEQERPRSGGPQPPQLTPESPRRERQVQIANRLPLHQRQTRAVVGYRQLGDTYLGSEATQLAHDCSGLVDVDLDANHLNPHARIVPTRTSRISAYRSREARTT